MDEIPVVWFNLHPDVCNHRSHWDTALLVDVFDGDVWRTPSPLAFTHIDANSGAPLGAQSLHADAGFDGAVVMVAGNFHRADVDRLNMAIARLAWVLIIVTSDEESAFPWDEVEHPNFGLWIMTPGDEHPWLGDDPRILRYIGEGPSPGTRDTLRDAAPFQPKIMVNDWWFMGRDGHAHRSAMMQNANRLHIEYPMGHAEWTSGFTMGLPQERYLVQMASTRTALCPSGLGTADSFRAYEAMECGALPIVDDASPQQPAGGYWLHAFPNATGPLPFPTVADWDRLPEIMEKALDGWPHNANRAAAWWQQEKRNMAYDLRNHVARLRHVGPTLWSQTCMADRMTAVLVTSPTPQNPETTDVAEVIESIRSQRDLENMEILVVADGVRPGLEAGRADYEEYVRRLVWQCAHRWRNVCAFVNPTWLHHGVTMRRMLEEVDTRLVLPMDHDTPLVTDRPIDWDGIARIVESGKANMIRLHHDWQIHPEHKHLMLDKRPQMVDGVPLIRTAQMSQRPHVADVDWYKRMLARYVGWDSKCFVEEVMYGPIVTGWQRDGFASWNDFRLWMYAPEGNMQRSIHLDTRGPAPNVVPEFAYDGETPRDAPRPQREHQ